jgi:hypothetical protein
VQVVNHHTALAEQVIKTLLYFDIFNYPLKATEVFKFVGMKETTYEDVTLCLNRLAKKKHIFQIGEFYSLQENQKNVTRRIKGNAQAEKWLPVARSRARLIACFPYVRAVMASGSLSKGYMDAKSDLDFFIVTTPNRLWVARTLLVLYKRVFLFNSHKQFCVNYFIDSTHLEIEEKNLFTATEIATLIPLYNSNCYADLLASNKWIYDYLPNFSPRTYHAGPPSYPYLQRLLEFLIEPLSTALGKLFMKITFRRWEKMYLKSYDKDDFDIAFKTNAHVSKNHPNFFQKKVLDLYQNKVSDYEKQFGQPGNYE